MHTSLVIPIHVFFLILVIVALPVHDLVVIVVIVAIGVIDIACCFSPSSFSLFLLPSSFFSSSIFFIRFTSVGIVGGGKCLWPQGR